jgi:hypothetical protein
MDRTGNIQLEQQVRTSTKAWQQVFGAMPRSRIALEIRSLPSRDNPSENNSPLHDNPPLICGCSSTLACDASTGVRISVKFFTYVKLYLEPPPTSLPPASRNNSRIGYWVSYA